MRPTVDSLSRDGSSNASGSSKLSEPHRLGLLAFDTTPNIPGSNDMRSEDISLRDLSSALSAPAGALACSRVTSNVRSSDSPIRSNGSPLMSVLDTLDGDILRRLASVFSRAASEAVSPARPQCKPGSHNASTIDGQHKTATNSRAVGNIHLTDESLREAKSFHSSDSALGALSDAMAQFREASIDSRASRHTHGLDDHRFTLIVPFDRALPILEIVEGIRAEFKLGNEGVQWEVRILNLFSYQATTV